MIWALLKQNVISCIKIFIVLFAVICMYTVVVIYMYNPELSKMLSDYQEALPQMMAAVGMTGVAKNLLEWIQIYLYGFIMNLFPLIFVIVVGNKLVMNYIDSGSMVNLLSTPHSRLRIILTQALSMIFFIVLLMAAVTGIGVLTCHIMFPGELDVGKYVQLNASAALLQLIVGGIAFTVACIASESRQYYTVGGGIPLVFLLLQMLSNMGEKMENLKYATIYTLFPAEKIIQGAGGCLIPNLSMAVIALVFFGISILWFRQRDLAL